MFMSSAGMGESARLADMVMYIVQDEKHAEEGGALDDEEQEEDVEEYDKVDVSVVAEMVDNGSEISRFCRRFSSGLSFLVVAGCSTDSRTGGGSSTSICI